MEPLRPSGAGALDVVSYICSIPRSEGEGGRAVDAQRIIEQIMADPRLSKGGRLSGGHFSSRVYGDEPILKTGRQLADERARERDERARERRLAAASACGEVACEVRPPVAARGGEGTGAPRVYREARAIAYSDEAFRRPRGWLFRRQGEVLADVEDDYPYDGSFDRYFPTYQDMTGPQLRGYISWRTEVRRGEAPRIAPTSYAFVYVYEILNGIGVACASEGFGRLRRFWGKFRAQVPALDRFLRPWLRDYVVYHGLDVGLLARDELLGGDIAADGALVVLQNPEGRDERELFSAVATLSSYRIEASRLFREQPDDVRRTVLAVLGRLEAYYRKNRTRGLYESLFGHTATLPCDLFASAVFYEERPHPDAVRALSPIRRYVCRNGAWTCERYSGGKGASTRLGSIVKAVDARMRSCCGSAPPLKAPSLPKYLQGIVDQEVDRWAAWKRAHTPRRIAIDRSKLGGIRRGAAQTCEELLVDEERGDLCEAGAVPPSLSQPTAVPAAAPQAFGTSAASATRGIADTPADAGFAAGGAPADDAGASLPLGLSRTELALLGCLLEGTPFDGALAGCAQTLDMLVDSINEKLFDVLGDTALEFEGGRPAVIEDYREDVRGAVGL